MTIPPGLNTILSEAYEHAEQRGFPPFSGNIKATTPVNSLPYVTTFQRFRARYTDERRHQLLSRLDRVLQRARDLGVIIEYMLCGGSFILLDKTPNDLDCVLFYRLAPEAAAAVPDLQELQIVAVKRGVDCRLIPLDGSPLVVLKSAIYFGLIYALEMREQDHPAVVGCGPILVSFEEE
jgi:hypothetical protein